MQYELKNNATERLKQLSDVAMAKKEECRVRHQMMLEGKPTTREVNLMKSQKGRARIKRRIAEAKVARQGLAIESLLNNVQNYPAGGAVDPDTAKQNLERLNKLVAAFQTLGRQLDAKDNTQTSTKTRQSTNTELQPVSEQKPKPTPPSKPKNK